MALELSRDRDPAHTASPVPSSSCLRDNGIQSLHDGRASDASDVDGPVRMTDENTYHRRPSKSWCAAPATMTSSPPAGATTTTPLELDDLASFGKPNHDEEIRIRGSDGSTLLEDAEGEDPRPNASPTLSETEEDQVPQLQDVDNLEAERRRTRELVALLEATQKRAASAEAEVFYYKLKDTHSKAYDPDEPSLGTIQRHSHHDGGMQAQREELESQKPKGPGSKPEICLSFLRHQRCRYGDRCHRIHVHSLETNCRRDLRPSVRTEVTDAMRNQARQQLRRYSKAPVNDLFESPPCIDRKRKRGDGSSAAAATVSPLYELRPRYPMSSLNYDG